MSQRSCAPGSRAPARTWALAGLGLALASGCHRISSGEGPTASPALATTPTAAASAEPPTVPDVRLVETAWAATPALPDVPGYAAPPGDWSRAEPHEVRDVPGSGCTALALGAWLKLTCPGFTEARLNGGHHLTQTTIERTASGVSITTLYVPGTNLVVALERATERHVALVRWLGAARPKRVAMITNERDSAVPAGDF